MNSRLKRYFDENGDLNDEGISLCAEAIVLERFSDLPEEVCSAAEKDPVTRKGIITLASSIDEKNLKSEPHPFFDAPGQDLTSPLPALKAASVILVTVMLGTMIAYYSGQFSNEDEAAHPIDYSENFSPNVYYESLTEQTAQGGEVDILEPGPATVKDIRLHFIWNGQINETYKLIILNNRAEQVITTSSDQNNYLLITKLDPGLYYWRLETGEELFFVGRFTVFGKQ